MDDIETSEPAGAAECQFFRSIGIDRLFFVLSVVATWFRRMPVFVHDLSILSCDDSGPVTQFGAQADRWPPILSDRDTNCVIWNRQFLI